MKSIKLCFLLFISINVISQESKTNYNNHVIVIHGGAGNFNSKAFSQEKHDEYYNTLNDVLNLGDSLLRAGVEAIEVVVYCIEILEDNPLFNAGRGSVLNIKGEVEMDASIMDGKTLNAGAATGLKRVKNPIKLAYEIMKDGKHVFLSGEGAEIFALKKSLELRENDYFITKIMRERYEQGIINNSSKGTVGVVVKDKEGNLAAGTSTGGMMFKQFGRIGDSPIIGAGTYADNNYCAVSCTGHGEFFIRHVAAYDVCAIYKYLNIDIETACLNVIKKIGDSGGEGGIISIDKIGNIGIAFNTKSMFRASLNSNGDRKIDF